MSKPLKISLILLFAIILVVGGIGFSAYQATQQVPEFYETALEIEPSIAAEDGEILEEQVFALSNQIRKPNRWELLLTEKQINGWLASDLEEKFPKLLPESIEKPRLSIKENELQLACQFKGKQFQSVMSLSVDVFLIEDEENVVAIRIHSASAGALPVPLSSLIDEVSNHTAKAEVPIRWKQMGNDPVALLTVPKNGDQIAGTIHVDTISLLEGEIYLAGETKEAETLEEAEAEVGAAQ